MELSIIILTYNTKAITLECLKSIDRYFPKLKTEVILVDNNSVDGTVDLVKKIKFKYFSPKITVNNKNLGFARGINIGINKAKGNYILLLNSDTKATEGSIDLLINNANNLPRVGVLGAKLINKDNSIQPSVFRLPTLFRALNQYLFGKSGILDKYAPQSNEPVEVEAVVGAVFLMTKKTIRNAGVFNERYFMYFEDLDYCRQVRKKGLKVYYVPAALFYHIHGASGKNTGEAKDQWKRLVPSSKIYHGELMHYLIFFVTWLGQKIRN